MAKLLTERFKDITVDTSTVSDRLAMMMHNIEVALSEAGAEPGVDYTYMDLATLSVAIIRDDWKAGRVTMVEGPSGLPR